VDVVCVDGSEGADRAMQFALRETPPEHRLLLLFGAYVPHKEEMTWGTFSVTSMREGHYWDKDLPDVYLKYTDMCQKAGRKCEFVHFHFDRMSKFGERVCSFAAKSHAQNVILARRRKSERTLVGRFLGSGSQAVISRCGDMPITLVTAKPDAAKLNPERK
jgi:nucleotide-binding universal stress UspA family protein